MTSPSIIDTTLGAAALSTPIWYQYIETGLGIFMLIGGSILLAIRLYLAIRDAKKKGPD